MSNDLCPGSSHVRLIPSLVLAALIVVTASLPGRADVVWLLPERFAVTPGATLGVDVMTGEEFASRTGTVLPERIATVAGTLAAQPVAATSPVLAGANVRILTTLTRPGVAVVAIDVKPEARTIEHGDVPRYFREIYAGDTLREAWARSGADAWHELRRLRTKTYVRVGLPGVDRAWAAALPVGIDLVPERDPTALAEGEELPVRLLNSGKPVADATVAFLADGGNREHVVLTDGSGRARARVDAPGLWSISAVVIGPSHDGWASEVVSLTIEVRGATGDPRVAGVDRLQRRLDSPTGGAELPWPRENWAARRERAFAEPCASFSLRPVGRCRLMTSALPLPGPAEQDGLSFTRCRATKQRRVPVRKAMACWRRGIRAAAWRVGEFELFAATFARRPLPVPSTRPPCLQLSFLREEQIHWPCRCRPVC